jgi:hypothetical protein
MVRMARGDIRSYYNVVTRANNAPVRTIDTIAIPPGMQ